MRKDNVRYKNNITLDDKINAINGIVGSYFTNGEYTPYFAEMAETIAIVTYFIDGIEFEEDDMIYDIVKSDDELSELVSCISSEALMDFVREQVDDKVQFIKQQIIHSHADMNKIIEACNVIIDSLENFSKLNIGQMSKEDMDTGLKVMRQLAEKDFSKDDMSEILKNAVGFKIDEAMEEILEEKNAEIRELKKYKQLWESRNVSSDKVVPINK